MGVFGVGERVNWDPGRKTFLEECLKVTERHGEGPYEVLEIREFKCTCGPDSKVWSDGPHDFSCPFGDGGHPQLLWIKTPKGEAWVSAGWLVPAY